MANQPENILLCGRSRGVLHSLQVRRHLLRLRLQVRRLVHLLRPGDRKVSDKTIALRFRARKLICNVSYTQYIYPSGPCPNLI